VLDSRHFSAGFEETDQEGGDHAGNQLDDNVDDGVLDFSLTPDQHGQRHGRIIMPARNVTPSIDHHHQHGADRQRCHRPCTRLDHRHPNRKDQEKRADKFDQILVHGLQNPFLCLLQIVIPSFNCWVQFFQPSSGCKLLS
jgi:hypothetical protein